MITYVADLHPGDAEWVTKHLDREYVLAAADERGVVVAENGW